MKTIILIFIVLGFFSCNEEKQNSIETDLVHKENTVDIFKVILNAKFLEDDKIELYYISELGEENFNANDRVAKLIKGVDQFQTIEFILPKNIIPYQFRIDIGDNINKHETQVDIKSISVELNANIINVDETILESFFQSNIYLERNQSGYLRQAIQGKYDPFLLAKPILIKKIEIEL